MNNNLLDLLKDAKECCSLTDLEAAIDLLNKNKERLYRTTFENNANDINGLLRNGNKAIVQIDDRLVQITLIRPDIPDVWILNKYFSNEKYDYVAYDKHMGRIILDSSKMMHRFTGVKHKAFIQPLIAFLTSDNNLINGQKFILNGDEYIVIDQTSAIRTKPIKEIKSLSEAYQVMYYWFNNLKIDVSSNDICVQ